MAAGVHSTKNLAHQLGPWWCTLLEAIPHIFWGLVSSAQCWYYQDYQFLNHFSAQFKDLISLFRPNHCKDSHDSLRTIETSMDPPAAAAAEIHVQHAMECSVALYNCVELPSDQVSKTSTSKHVHPGSLI